MINPVEVIRAIDLLSRAGDMVAPDLSHAEIQHILDVVMQQRADAAAQFAELLEANRWQRLYREKLRARAKAHPAQAPVNDWGLSPLRARMQAARDEAIRTGQTVKVAD